MKKVLACLMIACALLAVGCSGRNAAFGVVDIKKVEAEAPAVKTIREDLQKKAKELQEQLEKETAGKSQEEAEKIAKDKSAQMQVASSEAQSKLKASLDTALTEVSKEKNLSAVLVKDAVPSGGVDVTDDVIKKMK
ncbi:MAG: OmpH family outer membrane protein [Acidaminococcaceae bacterium]|jgi:outer membrane protein|nr:OmpH family outer membrane protein [Acidaminococcaceae bacterium]MBP3812194.1 OmpH family outer membrane protein [Acidaminococcaceae bacterium]MBR1494109.1 OmpH family outer membrane protein [Acidaminococcaceae bacterium]MBR1661076.1 OmpH family outer membrane protein [Acidaminococcaceae bacterium]